jgi:hypothetical protein
MLTDRLTTFGLAADATTNSNTTAKVGDEIDLVAARDIGNGKDMFVLLQIDTAFDGGGGANFELSVVSSDAVGLTTPNVHWTTGMMPITDPKNVVGYRWFARLPIDNYLRYLGVTISATAGNINVGKLDAFIVPHDHKWTPFTEAIS